jgi:hypothetical protein
MHRSALAASLALTFLSGLGVPASAQEDPGITAAETHPLHIHIGACPTPGEIVGPMSDVQPIAGDAVGAEWALLVESALSTVDLSLADLLATWHAVVVHRSHAAMADLIACGDIGGAMASPGQLVVGIGPIGGSGYAGIAVLTDRGDGSTTIQVTLTRFEPTAPSPGPRPYTY